MNSSVVETIREKGFTNILFNDDYTKINGIFGDILPPVAIPYIVRVFDKNLLIFTDQMGSPMPKEEMKQLIRRLQYTVDNLDFDELKKEIIKGHEKEISKQQSQKQQRKNLVEFYMC